MSRDDIKKDARTSFAFVMLAAIAASAWVGLGTALVEQRAAQAVSSGQVFNRH